MSLAQTIRDIKAIKIQGAECVARAGVDAILDLARMDCSKDSKVFLSKLDKACKDLYGARPVEPFLLNSLKYILAVESDSDLRTIKKAIRDRCREVILHFKDSRVIISQIGANKISNGMVVFTHCHSSTVIDILRLAWKRGIKFEVYNSETRPLYQGRKTASELAGMGIHVTHLTDSAVRMALKKADIMLIGCDMLTSEGKIVNKVGSELFAEAARSFGVPVYVCTNSWKFSVKSIYGIEQSMEYRSPKEIWDNPPRRVKIINYAFEKVDPELISGIISEFGIYKPHVFIEEIRKQYPWMFMS